MDVWLYFSFLFCFALLFVCYFCLLELNFGLFVIRFDFVVNLIEISFDCDVGCLLSLCLPVELDYRY